MTVDAYLRTRVPGYPFSDRDIEGAVASVLFAEPTPLRALNLDDEISDIADSEEWTKSLKYAESSLYYAIAGVFSGGSKSEQVGDIKVSTSGYSITQADRARFCEKADKLREQIGCTVDASSDNDDGMFDATPLMYGAD
jgi:hypothetical protein